MIGCQKLCPSYVYTKTQTSETMKTLITEKVKKSKMYTFISIQSKVKLIY